MSINRMNMLSWSVQTKGVSINCGTAGRINVQRQEALQGTPMRMGQSFVGIVGILTTASFLLRVADPLSRYKPQRPVTRLLRLWALGLLRVSKKWSSREHAFKGSAFGPRGVGCTSRRCRVEPTQ
jgi:hypothetical protein